MRMQSLTWLCAAWTALVGGPRALFAVAMPGREEMERVRDWLARGVVEPVVAALTVVECVDKTGASTFAERCPPGSTKKGEKELRGRKTHVVLAQPDCAGGVVLGIDDDIALMVDGPLGTSGRTGGVEPETLAFGRRHHRVQRIRGGRAGGVEPIGAPTLYESLKAGELVTLDAIETVSGSLAPRRSMPINLDLIQAHVDRMVLVSDDEMREAARWLWFECGVAAELAGAASLAALMTGRHQAAAGETVVAVICGAGTDGIEV